MTLDKTLWRKAFFQKLKGFLNIGEVGFEKESLRVINSSIAQVSSPRIIRFFLM